MSGVVCAPFRRLTLCFVCPPRSEVEFDRNLAVRPPAVAPFLPVLCASAAVCCLLTFPGAGGMSPWENFAAEKGDGISAEQFHTPPWLQGLCLLRALGTSRVAKFTPGEIICGEIVPEIFPPPVADAPFVRLHLLGFGIRVWANFSCTANNTRCHECDLRGKPHFPLPVPFF